MILNGRGGHATEREERAAVMFQEMLNPSEYRALAREYCSRAEADGVTKRLANVLMSVSRSYMSLATQLELLEQVEKEEAERHLHQRAHGSPSPSA
jgi:hypothetical protein